MFEHQLAWSSCFSEEEMLGEPDAWKPHPTPLRLMARVPRARIVFEVPTPAETKTRAAYHET